MIRKYVPLMDKKGKKYCYFYKANIIFPETMIKKKNKFFYDKFIKFLKKFNVNEDELDNHILSKERILRNISNVRKLLLEITEDCNLRCRYCVFSGKFIDRRKHSQKKMKLPVAKKAIDYIISWSKKQYFYKINPYNFLIGFYGGEPLMNFELIKKIVKYSKKEIKTIKNAMLNFSITTNGLLLEKYYKFLIKNNFNITISIDGPEEINDKNRGKGTFNKVYDIILYLYNNYPDFYKDHISFSIVYTKDVDLFKILKFFNKDVFEKSLRLDLGYVVEGFSSLKFPIYGQGESKVIKHIKSKKEKGLKLSKIEKSILSSYFNFTLNILTIKGYGDYGSACVLGSKTLFVDTSGNFLGCEKGCRSFNIGNVYYGFNIKKIKEIEEKWLMATKNCKTCIAQGFCSACVANTGLNNNIVIDKHCMNTINNFNRKIYDYLELM